MVPIDAGQLARWKRLLAGGASAGVTAHASLVRLAALALLALAEQQAEEIARLEAELEVTTRDLDRLATAARRPRPARAPARRDGRRTRHAH